MTALAATGLLVALGLTATAAAVEVRGRLEIPSGLDVPPEGAFKPYWDEWNGFVDPEQDEFEADRQLAVVLRGEGPGEPVGCKHRLHGGDLHPATLVAKTGTTLRIENRDGCSHELYAEGLDPFSPLQTAPGNARTLKIGEAGDWPVRDKLYPHVRGHLHVLPDLVACGSVDGDGQYQFDDVPSGTYKLAVYHGDELLAEQPIEVSGSGQQTIDPIALEASQ